MLCRLRGLGGLRAELLVNDHSADENDTDNVGQRSGDYEGQTTGSKQESEEPVDLLVQMSAQCGRNAEYADHRGYSNLYRFGNGGVHEQEAGAVGKDVGYDEGCDRKSRRRECGFHRVGLRYCRACVCRKCDGRRDVGDDAEVEHEEVRRNGVDADGGVDEDGSAGGRHDAEVCGRGNAHAENDAAEHGEEQCNELNVARKSRDCADELAAEARHGDGACDAARHCAGGDYGDAALAAVGKGVEYHEAGLFDDDAALGAFRRSGGFYRCAADLKQSDEYRKDYRNGCGERHGVGVSGDENDKHHEGDEQVNAALELPEGRQLGSRNALQSDLFRLKVNGDEDARKVQDGGDYRIDDDLRVGLTEEVDHKEGGCTHDGGHDLTAGGRRRFDGACKFGLIAGALHHRDGDGAGGDGVADGGAGDHSAQCGGQDRNLRRTACGGAGNGVCKAYEVGRNARALKESAEDDEHDDVLRADVDRRGEQTGGRVEKIVHDILHTVICAETLRKAPVVPRIHHECARNDEDGDADAAAAKLDDCDNADDGDRNFIGIYVQLAEDDALGVYAEVHERRSTRKHDDNVVPGDMIYLLYALLGGVKDVPDEKTAGKKARQAHTVVNGNEHGEHDAEDRECRCDRHNDILRHALPNTGVRLPVILFHHRFDVCGYALGALFGAGGVFGKEVDVWRLALVLFK